VVPLDRGDQGASNGAKFVLVVAVLAMWQWFEKGSGKKNVMDAVMALDEDLPLEMIGVGAGVAVV
jgi:hypothetical protein